MIRRRIVSTPLIIFFYRKILCCLTICAALVVENVDPVKPSCRFLKKSTLSLEERGARHFTNTWAVRIPGGVNNARTIAQHLGYLLQRRVSRGLPDIYLFENPNHPELTTDSDDSVTQYLKKFPQIIWAEQQVAEVRKSRWYRSRKTRSLTRASELSWEDPIQADQCPDSDGSNATGKSALNLNDKYWPKQYYLKNCGKIFDELPGDLNVAPVWIKHRLFGKNIKVIVVDDGIETKHLELVENYDPTLGLDLEDNDRTPDPPNYRFFPSLKFRHGTRCAGVIAMKGNNTLCGVGIAPSVSLGAVRLLGLHPMTDYKISQALLFKHVGVHIMSNSWGPLDDGKWMPYLGPLTRAALKTGVNKGREGRGVIYVFAAGNGKMLGDHCGCDAMVSSPYTITVASCDHRGMVTHFSERCASIMVTTYSGEGESLFKVISSDIGGDKCTTDHDGTSASAPMVAGAVALALEANPKLSWRDVQHLLAWTCQVAPLQNNLSGIWARNGAGFYVSHDFGFGLLDINKLIESAKIFRSVGSMNSCITSINLDEDEKNFRNGVNVEVTTDGCEGTPSEIAYLEHVQLTVAVAYPNRGALRIVLRSPAGTSATLLDYRPRDTHSCGVRSWTFDSVMTWGESPKGKWTVFIDGKKLKSPLVHPKSSMRKMWLALTQEKGRSICYACGEDTPVHSRNMGELNDLTLAFHGTKTMPSHYEAGPRPYDGFEFLV